MGRPRSPHLRQGSGTSVNDGTRTDLRRERSRDPRVPPRPRTQATPQGAPRHHPSGAQWSPARLVCPGALQRQDRPLLSDGQPGQLAVAARAARARDLALPVRCSPSAAGKRANTTSSGSGAARPNGNVGSYAATEPAMSDDLMLELAHDLVGINEQLAEATGARAGELAIAGLATRHDLIVVVGGECDCDEGTCPGLITRSATA